MARRIIYTYDFADAVDAEIPKELIEAMSLKGWNALGIWETVNKVRRDFKKRGERITNPHISTLGQTPPQKDKAK